MTEKKKRGRPPKYDRIDLKQVEDLARFGLTDTQIAVILKISERSLNYYKKKPQFLQSIKRGKLEADQQVIKSLYLRAIGYEHEEEKIFQYEGEPIKVPTIRHYPPDPTAMIFWLKNRMPELWKDKQNIEHSGKLKHEVDFSSLWENYKKIKENEKGNS